MVEILENFKSLVTTNRVTFYLIFIILAVAVIAFFSYRVFFSRSLPQLPEIDITFDPEGPYALLIPRRDGNALSLNLKRTSSYDSINYELAYNAEGIDRGVVGDINTTDKKGEYEQEILFGTCSKNVCKYDKGVANGTLTLHIRKGRQPYKMITQWHIQKPDVDLGKLTSGDNHFNYQSDAKREDLALVGFTIINDLTGVPKLPDGREVLGKVYALNPPLAKEVPGGKITVELAENPPVDAKIARYTEGANRWEELETKISGSKLSAEASGSGIFAVFTFKK